MKLILARHAQTLENSQKIVQAYGGHLSDIGEQQAKRLALRLKDEKIDYIYSSDFDRAIKSANEVRFFPLQIPLTLDKRLREADFSNYIGDLFLDYNPYKDNIDTLIVPYKAINRPMGREKMLFMFGAVGGAIAGAIHGAKMNSKDILGVHRIYIRSNDNFITKGKYPKKENIIKIIK